MTGRNQACREAMEKVKDLCDISDATIKKTKPVTDLVNQKGNAHLDKLKTDAIIPITKIKDRQIQRSVISEIRKSLLQRNNKGDFVKERLTKSEVETLIGKYEINPKKKIRERPPSFRANKSQYTLLKRIVSLKLATTDREAFSLLFKWGMERIVKKK